MQSYPVDAGLSAGMQLQTKAYLLRILLFSAGLILVLVWDGVCHQSPFEHPFLLATATLYPHIGHIVLGHLGLGQRRSYVLFVTDGFLIGWIVVALDFSFVSSVMLVAINLFNWMVIGGIPLFLLGLVAMLIGVFLFGTHPGPSTFLLIDSCQETHVLAGLFAIIYFLIVAYIIHQLISRLRLKQIEFQARSDTASQAQAMAEKALLSVLPPSMAKTMANAETCPAEYHVSATILHMEFVSNETDALSLEQMRDIFAFTETILHRHGVDIIKTFGTQAIALSSHPNAVEMAFLGFHEVDSYVKNRKESSESPSVAPIRIKGILHTGSLCIGLVQPERFNIDLFGEALQEIKPLCCHPAIVKTAGLLLTDSAFDKLTHDTYEGWCPNPIIIERMTCYLFGSMDHQ